MSGYKVGSVAGLITEKTDIKPELVDLFTVKQVPQTIVQTPVKPNVDSTVQNKKKSKKSKAGKEPGSAVTQTVETQAVASKKIKKSPEKKLPVNAAKANGSVESTVAGVPKLTPKKTKKSAVKSVPVDAPKVEGSAESIVAGVAQEAPKAGSTQKKKKKRKASSTPGEFGIQVLPSKPNLKKLNEKAGPVSIEDLPSPAVSDSESDDEGSKDKKNKPKKTKKKVPEKKKEDETPEDLSTTVFVKNIPIKSQRKELAKFFSKYGKVEKVWLRCVPVDESTTSKKVAAIMQKFHPSRSSLSACVKFKVFQEAAAAVADSGVQFENHHLSISWARGGKKDKTQSNQQHDTKKAVFVGALPFALEDEELWNHFKECGRVVDVRIIRDSQSGLGKGFGYVNFETEDAVELALKLNGSTLCERYIRVKRSTTQPAKAQRPESTSQPKPAVPKKINKANGKKQAPKGAPASSSPQKIASFAGETADEKGNKKAKKLGAGEKKKRLIAKKLGAA